MTKRLGRFPLLSIASAVCLSPLFEQVDENPLRNKFGPPVNGIFQVRPNITLSVTYGDNHKICKLELRTTRYAPVIPVSVVEELLNEIIPPCSRGTPRERGMICAGLCWHIIEFDAITIGQGDADVIPSPYSKGVLLAEVRVKSPQAAKP